MHLRALEEAEDVSLRKEVEEEIREAATKAEKAGPPDLASMFEDVYARVPWNLEEQRRSLEGK